MPTDPEPPAALWRLLAGLLALAIPAALIILGSQPGAGQLFRPPWDKLAHMTVFALFAIATKLTWPRLADWKIFVLAGVVGLADELHQTLIPGRTPAFDDGLADLVGALIGLTLLQALVRRRP